jgi:hypothetical protein
MDENGYLTETIVATSADGMVTMTLPAGTRVLPCEGDGPVEEIEVQKVTPPPPPPPPDGYIIAAYDFGTCCTFNPPISLTIQYDPEALPEGFSEEDLVIGYYDGVAWVFLDTDVDSVANEATADGISHLTVFAVLAPAPAPAPGLGPGAWAGISVLGLFLLVLLGLIIWALTRRHRVPEGAQPSLPSDLPPSM